MNNTKKTISILVILAFVLTVFPTFAEEIQIAVASFQIQTNAQAFVKAMADEGFDVVIEEVLVRNIQFYRILSSKKHTTRAAALQELKDIQTITYFKNQDTSDFWLRPSTISGIAPVAAAAPAPAPWTPSSPLEQTAQEAYLQREDPTQGLIAGKILDALTGNGLPSVDVSLDSTGTSTVSDKDGGYTLQAPVGKSFTLNFKKTGYTLEPQRVEVLADRPSVIPENRTVGNPFMEEGSRRFVLTWGDLPRDLDSHLLTPSGAHVYFGKQKPANAGAQLDTDNTTSYGPETITIESQQPGRYIYLVHNYSEYPNMAGTEAMVKVFDQAGLTHTLKIPSEGQGDYWVVGTLDNEGFKPINEITDELDFY